MLQEKELCLFQCVCSRTSIYDWERTPRDTQIELLLQAANICDPASNSDVVTCGSRDAGASVFCKHVSLCDEATVTAPLA